MVGTVVRHPNTPAKDDDSSQAQACERFTIHLLRPGPAAGPGRQYPLRGRKEGAANRTCNCTGRSLSPLGSSEANNDGDRLRYIAVLYYTVHDSITVLYTYCSQ